MARLITDTPKMVNGFYWFTVVDSEKESCNYIARTKGCYRDHNKAEYICIKCFEVVNWLQWPNKNNAKSICECGQKHTLQYITLQKAKVIQ